MTQVYTFGYSPAAINLLEHRSVKNEADIFLNHLTPSMTLLDVGCGPGNLTLEFAERLHQGKVSGVDISETQIKRANEKAKMGNINNCDFQVASIFSLPFEDNSFDAVWCANVLLNFKEQTQIRNEFKRVLKPNGVLGLLEQHSEANLYYPRNSAYELFYQSLNRALEFNGGDPNVGKRLPEIYSQDGFVIQEAAAICKVGSPEHRKAFGEFVATLWTEAEFPKLAVEQGWLSKEKYQRLAETLKIEATTSSCFCGRAVVKIVAKVEKGNHV
ncbi:hypothetical protein SOPP22_09590 [Shewanella sp. OPT22]|nr:hypothetical protein SOPP22_09590 [Shewanella sp. OPT22]